MLYFVYAYVIFVIAAGLFRLILLIRTAKKKTGNTGHSDGSCMPISASGSGNGTSCGGMGIS